MIYEKGRICSYKASTNSTKAFSCEKQSTYINNIKECITINILI